LIGLLLIRLLMKVVLSSSIQIGQLSGMFFLLAFGMILPWRVAMYIQYRRLMQELDEGVRA
jgi:membrane protein CcdC involved in cytochrome C biogenesis